LAEEKDGGKIGRENIDKWEMCVV